MRLVEVEPLLFQNHESLRYVRGSLASDGHSPLTNTVQSEYADMPELATSALPYLQVMSRDKADS